ncbi:hypothetical protein KW796_03035 [Candidatus Parcubacteria bacterium]|nr:hypothetical protein [Candidatus Parcubacteria bacterium]
MIRNEKVITPEAREFEQKVLELFQCHRRGTILSGVVHHKPTRTAPIPEKKERLGGRDRQIIHDR